MSLQFSEVLSHLSFSSSLTDIFFLLNMSIKVIIKTYEIYFVDKVMKFLVGSSSVQRPYNY